MTSFRRNVFLISSLLCLSSPHASASHCELPKSHPAFLRMIKAPRSLYGMTETFEANVAINGRGFPRCRTFALRLSGLDPVSKTARELKAVSYLPVDGSPSLLRTVIVMPPNGGENPIDRMYAEELCAAGMRAVILQGWDGETIGEPGDLGSHDRGFLRGIAALQDLLLYLAPRHLDQVGILGTSLGGIGASLLLGLDNRVNTAVLIVAGAGIPEIIAHSKERTMVALREKRFALLGYRDNAEYERELTKALKIEPETFVRWAKPKKVLTLLATRDTNVPTENQLRLYAAFGGQELRTRDANHVPAIVGFSLHERGNIVDHFLANLRPAAAGDKPVGQNDVCANRAR